MLQGYLTGKAGLSDILHVVEWLSDLRLDCKTDSGFRLDPPAPAGVVPGARHTPNTLCTSHRSPRRTQVCVSGDGARDGGRGTGDGTAAVPPLH